MAAKTIWKPDKFVRFSNGKNKMADFTIWKPDTNSVRKVPIRIPDGSYSDGYCIKKNVLERSELVVTIWSQAIILYLNVELYT